MDSEQVFVSGLLCHIGELVIALNVPHMIENVSASGPFRISSASQQRELFGFDYIEVGAELLLAWRLPRSLESVVRFHGAPDRATEFVRETAIVHISARLVELTAAEINEDVVRLIGISRAELALINNDIDEASAEVLALMQPSKHIAT